MNLGVEGVMENTNEDSRWIEEEIRDQSENMAKFVSCYHGGARNQRYWGAKKIKNLMYE